MMTSTLDLKRTGTYYDIMAKFSLFVRLATKDDAVINRTFDELDSLKSEMNEGMPSTLALKAKLYCHPAHNVPFGGAQNTKKIYRYSNCGEIGHNKAKCPLID